MTDTLEYIQEDRFAAVTTVLGDDALLLLAVEGEERIGSIPRFSVTAQSPEEIDPDDLLGTTCSIAFTKERTRVISGIITRFERELTTEDEDSLIDYHFELRPKLWTLTQTSACRSFVNRTAGEIIEIVCKEYFINVEHPDGSTRLSESQYNETDYDFIYRLMQREGWLFTFTYDENDQQLMVSDSLAGLGESLDIKLEGYSEVRELRTTQVTELYYDYNKPGASSRGTSSSKPAADNVSRVAYRNSTADLTPDDANHYSESVLQTARMGMLRYRAETSNDELTIGTQFTPDPAFDFGGDAVVIATRWSISNQPYEVGGGGGEDSEEEFTCEFEFVSIQTPFALPGPIRFPDAPGVQFATVTANDDPDDLGRVQLYYPWDENGGTNKASTDWVRVSQMWASRGFGGHSVPQIGDEVIVGFEQGNPNRPVVIGRLHNAANQPPGEAGVTHTTLRTLAGHRLVFTDPEDANPTPDTDGDPEDVGIYLRSTNNFARTVDENDTLTVTGNRTVTIDQGDESITLNQGSRTLNVAQGDINTTADTGSIALEAGTQISLKVGGNSISITTSGIEITVGGSSVSLTESGITVSGQQVSVEGQASLELKSSATAELSAGAETTIKGGIVQIN